MTTLENIFSWKDRRQMEERLKELFGYKEFHRLPFSTFTDSYIGDSFLHDLIPAILVNLTIEEAEKLRDFIDEVLFNVYKQLLEKSYQAAGDMAKETQKEVEKVGG